MALRTVPMAALLLAVALVLAACCSGAGGCEADGGAGCFRAYSLVGCAPPPGTPAAADDGTAFRGVLAPMLAALPSAAAATGFASLRSEDATGADRGHAFGLCFGQPDGCLACLSAAAAAVTEACGNDTYRAGVWRDGCLLAYTDDDGNEDAGFQFLRGDTRDQALADLARALTESKGRSLWKKAVSVLFYALAAVGAVAIVLLLCLLIAAFMIAQTLFRHSTAGHAAAHGQGREGITAYFVATDGRSPLWSVGVQMRFY